MCGRDWSSDVCSSDLSHYYRYYCEVGGRCYSYYYEVRGRYYSYYCEVAKIFGVTVTNWLDVAKIRLNMAEY